MKSIYSSKAKSLVFLFLIVFISYGFKLNYQNDLSHFSETINYCKSNKSEAIDGWIKLGISQDLLIKKLGEPDQKGEEEYWGATGKCARVLECSNAHMLNFSLFVIYLEIER